MTEPNNRRRWSHRIATAIGVLLALPLAVALGAFCGWCLGTTAGGWLTRRGEDDTASYGGLLGGAAGAVFAAARLVAGSVQTHTERGGKAGPP